MKNVACKNMKERNIRGHGEHTEPRAKGAPPVFKMLVVSLVEELEWNHLYELQYLADSTDLDNQTQEIWRGEGKGGGGSCV